MKYGVRKPNVKKSIKARTTGKSNGRSKRQVNPLYGKKGMGIVKRPEKGSIQRSITERPSVYLAL